MKLTFEHPYYCARGTYFEREIPKRAGFRWNAEKRYWFTRDTSCALRLIDYADDQAKALLTGAQHATIQTQPVLLTYRNGNYVATVRRDAMQIAHRAGFQWNEKQKAWYASDSYFAVKLIRYADPATRVRIEQEEAMRLARLAASRAKDADMLIPAPAGRTYMPFQRAGIAFALPMEGALIADEMGLGKTVQALGMINALPEIRYVLIVCPASLKINWRRECNRWLTDLHLKLSIATPSSWPRPPHSVLEHGQVVIINYDILGKYKRQIDSRTWDLVIFDEIHFIKNSDAQRTKLARQIKAKRRLGLTGTPLPNRPRELWSLISWLDPHTWNNKSHFLHRYCDAQQTTYGLDDKGASNLEELQERLRGSVMVRRLKSEVLTELPPKRRQMIEIPAVDELITAERAAVDKHKAELAELKRRIAEAEVSADELAYRDSVKQLRQAEFTGGIAELSKVRHQTALAKVPAVLEHLRDCLDSGKVVCFAYHHDVINQLSAPFGDACVVLTGENTQLERQASVDRFQQDESCRLFIGSITAAGVGLTLTASSHVLFAELDWVPGNMRQAEDRCHRIGQRDSVLVQYLVMESSIDADMARQLVEKDEIIEQALDKEAPRELFEVRR